MQHFMEEVKRKDEKKEKVRRQEYEELFPDKKLDTLKFFLMERCAGDTLDYLIAIQHRFSMKEVQSICRSLILFLAIANHFHLVHADFACRNIMYDVKGVDREWTVQYELGTDSMPTLDIDEKNQKVTLQSHQNRVVSLPCRTQVIDFNRGFMWGPDHVEYPPKKINFNRILPDDCIVNAFFILNPNEGSPIKNNEVWALGRIAIELSYLSQADEFPVWKEDEVHELPYYLFRRDIFSWCLKYMESTILKKKGWKTLLENFKKVFHPQFTPGIAEQYFITLFVHPLIIYLVQSMKDKKRSLIGKNDLKAFFPPFFMDLDTKSFTIQNKRTFYATSTGMKWFKHYKQQYLDKFYELLQEVSKIWAPVMRKWNLPDIFWNMVSKCISWSDLDAEPIHLLDLPFMYTPCK
jgi:hypothetical protein